MVSGYVLYRTVCNAETKTLPAQGCGRPLRERRCSSNTSCDGWPSCNQYSALLMQSASDKLILTPAIFMLLQSYTSTPCAIAEIPNVGAREQRLSLLGGAVRSAFRALFTRSLRLLAGSGD